MNQLIKNYEICEDEDLKKEYNFSLIKMGLNYLDFEIENKINDMIKFGISLLIKRME